MRHFLLFAVSLYFQTAYCLTFTMQNDGQCVYEDIQPLQTLAYINDRQCAMACNQLAACAAFMTVAANKTCGLYTAIVNSWNYTAQTYSADVSCRIGLFYVSRFSGSESKNAYSEHKQKIPRESSLGRK